MRKMRKAAVCAALALTGVMLLSGCFGKSEKAEPAVNAAADGVLTVGIIDGEDAYAFRNTGEEGPAYGGIEPTILEGLAGALEATVEYKEAKSVEDLITMLDAGQIDIAAGRLTKLEVYAGSHLTTRNYARRGLYLITGKNRYVDTLAGFDEGTVGLSWQIPSSATLEIPHIGNLQQTSYSNISEIPADIEAGVICGALCTEREAVSLLESGAQIQVSELQGGNKLEAVFYLAPDQTELTAMANSAINAYLDGLANPAKEE